MSPNCAKPAAGEVSLTKGHYSLLIVDEADATTSFAETYTNPARWDGRAYWSEAQQNFVFEIDGKEYKIPQRFLNSLRRHIETALARGYADHVFYPDLGHVHLMVPQDSGVAADDYENIMALPQMKFLFHTAELYKMRDNVTGPLLGDDWWKWRYFSRNLIASNGDVEDMQITFAKDNALYNTVRTLPDHDERATVYMNSNQNGCFSYVQNGQTLQFDLRLN